MSDAYQDRVKLMFLQVGANVETMTLA